MYIVTIKQEVLMNPWNMAHVWMSLMDAVDYIRKFYPSAKGRDVKIIKLGI